MKFVRITKISNPDLLDHMHLPVYEEVVVPLSVVRLTKTYERIAKQNGREMSMEDAFLEYLDRKNGLPAPRIYPSGYKYYAAISETGDKFEISDHEFHRLSKLLLEEQE